MKGHVEAWMGIYDPLCACQLGLSVVLLTAHVLPDREPYFVSVGCPQCVTAK